MHCWDRVAFCDGWLAIASKHNVDIVAATIVTVRQRQRCWIMTQIWVWWSTRSVRWVSKSNFKYLFLLPRCGKMCEWIGFQVGFKLNNNYGIVGPMVIFPRTVLQWNIDSIEDVHEQSLSLLLAVEPKLEIVIIGVGDEDISPELNDRIHAIFKSTGIAVEVLQTKHVSTVLLKLCSSLSSILNAYNNPVCLFYSRR